MRPPNPPTSAPREAININTEEGLLMVSKIESGPTFCQVDRVRHRGHLIEFITEGNQK